MNRDPVSDVPDGNLLLVFADVVLGSDDAVLATARDTLCLAIGVEGLSDAAAVIGGFDGITRIADAIGIPLEPEKAEATDDFFRELDIGRFRREKF
jgi:hypothetical protein